ncbi:MAG: DUF4386 family protein [Paracoccaceae bacterium]|nr:DUF4386 family protein [Paracoccaceae bacterium]
MDDPTARGTARIAGLAYLAMTAAALLGAFDETLLADVAGPGWPEAVPRGLLRLGLAQRVVALMDIVVAAALWALFRPAAPRLSALTAAARLAYVALFALAQLQIWQALAVTGEIPAGTTGVSAVEAALGRYRAIWDAAFALFAAHLLLLARLIWGGGLLRQVLAALLAIAGLGYLVDSLIAFALPQTVFRFAPYTFVGEMTLMLWLLAGAPAPRRFAR